MIHFVLFDDCWVISHFNDLKTKINTSQPEESILLNENLLATPNDGKFNSSLFIGLLLKREEIPAISDR